MSAPELDLLSLPAECRLHIYRHLFRSTTIPLPRYVDYWHRKGQAWRDENKAIKRGDLTFHTPVVQMHKSLSILLVNRHIHDEAQPLVLPSITLQVNELPIISIDDDGTLFDDTLDETLASYALTTVRYLEISYLRCYVLEPFFSYVFQKDITLVTQILLKNLVSLTITGWPTDRQDLFPSSADATLLATSIVGTVRTFEASEAYGSSDFAMMHYNRIKMCLGYGMLVTLVSGLVRLDVRFPQSDILEVEVLENSHL